MNLLNNKLVQLAIGIAAVVAVFWITGLHFNIGVSSNGFIVSALRQQ